MTPAQGQQQTAADRQTAIDQLTVLNQKMQELAVSTNDPAIVAGAASIAARCATWQWKEPRASKRP